ncbi:hypothetical protein M427DRAFT_38722 [Gonapodya prolifera JEL478]|uniref:Uncharacterized protein n=1 Tax=Gonapodya prolifera (strain JEL478) TaxID=1344416 RepID=A0A138ZZ88_GONPJ|nr:hypothetical protein M427DRAFT_38722 [Gonapodya prolifera JEL478]|eukprot:KXS09585.1 hypothetical protein M427DRAFT_38722 [Gonapodya prolifera JEL478]
MASPQVDGHKWRELKRAVDEENWDVLARTQDVLDKYMQWRESVLPQYVSAEDYLKETIFSWPMEADPVSGRKHALEWPADRPTPEPVIRLNDFPYSAEPGIVHQVVWFHPKHALPTFASVMDAIHRKYSPERFEFLVWENPLVRKTVPGVPHWHCFVRAKTIYNS